MVRKEELEYIKRLFEEPDGYIHYKRFSEYVNIEGFNKQLFRDCVLIFIIIMIILHSIDYYKTTDVIKTDIFTSEPPF